MSEGTWLFVVGVIPLAVGVALSVYEVIRRSDVPWLRKIFWIAVLVAVPPIGLALYVIARPPRHRAAIADAAPGVQRAERVVELVEQNVSGSLDDDDYRAALDRLGSPTA